ncbi:fluoride efflux transporter FluC [Prochlorococcus sp. MIT 1341]|uniref:fluoride efflux transporter FluC n=1 Tax=Prochlorococcus sp. MIT 1341 TaxID=3096221 RepID=UPI0039BF9B0A
MLEDNIVLSQFFFVSIGACFGTLARFNFVRYFQSIYELTFLGTLTVNILASFALGLFISIEPLVFSQASLNSLILFFGVGFLGSLSTFSSFILDILQSIFDDRYKDAILIFLFSLIGGFVAIVIGYSIGKAW